MKLEYLMNNFNQKLVTITALNNIMITYNKAYKITYNKFDFCRLTRL